MFLFFNRFYSFSHWLISFGSCNHLFWSLILILIYQPALPSEKTIDFSVDLLRVKLFPEAFLEPARQKVEIIFFSVPLIKQQYDSKILFVPDDSANSLVDGLESLVFVPVLCLFIGEVLLEIGHFFLYPFFLPRQERNTNNNQTPTQGASEVNTLREPTLHDNEQERTFWFDFLRVLLKDFIDFTSLSFIKYLLPEPSTVLDDLLHQQICWEGHDNSVGPRDVLLEPFQLLCNLSVLVFVVFFLEVELEWVLVLASRHNGSQQLLAAYEPFDCQFVLKLDIQVLLPFIQVPQRARGQYDWPRWVLLNSLKTHWGTQTLQPQRAVLLTLLGTYFGYEILLEPATLEECTQLLQTANNVQQVRRRHLLLIKMLCDLVKTLEKRHTIDQIQTLDGLTHVLRIRNCCRFLHKLLKLPFWTEYPVPWILYRQF